MLVPLIILLVVAAGLVVLWVLAERKASQLAEAKDEVAKRLATTESNLTSMTRLRTAAQTKAEGLAAEKAAVENERNQVRLQLADVDEALRKRTDLADAQAMQIDTLSAARDELQERLNAAEERIVTLAARPGVVVGELSTEDSNAEMLWDLEVARSERAWRNSVAINPVDDPSPFETSDDPVRTAIEIEASALREDVGAMISVDWSAEAIQSPSRRLIVVRVAQELLALASRAPGAAKLVVAQDADGELTLEFETVDETSEVINLIPPQISNDLIDVRNDTSLSVTVRAEPKSA